MSKFFPLLVLGLFLFQSCKKDNPAAPVNTEPQTVTFNYGGAPVTYGVIQRTSTKDASGAALSKPVTKYWLDRNLGATRVAQSFQDSEAVGDLFQWGRLADGHQRRTSQTLNTQSTSASPGHDKFITGGANSDWLVTHNDALWNAPYNANSPCPQGWRVPTADELGMEIYAWDSLGLLGAYGSPMKWTACGDRDGAGHVLYTGYWAFVWSSTPKENGEAGALAIIGESVVSTVSGPRCFGMAVRCIKE